VAGVVPNPLGIEPVVGDERLANDKEGQAETANAQKSHQTLREW
jgi:hypothetical protein